MLFDLRIQITSMLNCYLIQVQISAEYTNKNEYTNTIWNIFPSLLHSILLRLDIRTHDSITGHSISGFSTSGYWGTTLLLSAIPVDCFAQFYQRIYTENLCKKMWRIDCFCLEAIFLVSVIYICVCVCVFSVV